MGYEANTGLGVFNHYGTRDTEAGVVSGGFVETDGIVQEAVVYITGEDFGTGTSFNTQLTIPAGSKVLESYTDITTAFSLGGTAPTIVVGTDTSEATNFAVKLTQTQAQATTPIYSTTTGGTMSAVLAADTAIGVALGGTSPTVTSAGKAKVVIRYIKA